MFVQTLRNNVKFHASTINIASNTGSCQYLDLYLFVINFKKKIKVI